MMGDSELKEPPADERFVGEGERTALKILKNGDYADTLSERQEKETLDIVIFRVTKPTIVVRVQDKHHDSILKTGQDLVQKQMLEWNGCVVVDLWHKECPTLWSETVNEKSYEEISVYLRKAELI